MTLPANCNSDRNRGVWKKDISLNQIVNRSMINFTAFYKVHLNAFRKCMHFSHCISKSLPCLLQQAKLFKNTSQYGKRLSKWDVATRV